jgi:hypothetical protein
VGRQDVAAAGHAGHIVPGELKKEK